MCNLDKHRRIPANGSEGIFRFPKITQGDIVGIQRHGAGVVIEIPLDLPHGSSHRLPQTERSACL